ncbi:MAG: carboxypeptidase-like regulatory domain-containing protein, partial [Flavipsychrobacter sp.]
MNRLKRVTSLSFLFCLFALIGFAQAPVAPPAVGRVSGTVVDAQGKPVSYATVTLLRKDSSVVSGDLSKDDGSFSIGPTGVGSFILRVNAIGLLQKTVPVEITADNPNKKVNVKVSAAATALKSVEVVGERPLMEMSVDKKVFNVEKNITTAGGSATDVLSNVPAVTVDADGNVSL